MKKELLFPLSFLLVLLSCSPRTSLPIEEPEDIFVGATDSLFNLELLYVAATPDYLIFEAEFINNSDDSLKLLREDFELRIPQQASKSAPYTTDDLVEFLLAERKATKKAKRNRTILNGLSLVGNIFFAFSGGPITLGNLDLAFYSLSDVLILTDDRRFSNRQIASIDDQIDYLREVNIDSVMVAPNEKVYKEIFFPFDEFVIGDVEVIYQPGDIEYQMILDREELRIRE